MSFQTCVHLHTPLLPPISSNTSHINIRHKYAAATGLYSLPPLHKCAPCFREYGLKKPSDIYLQIVDLNSSCPSPFRPSVPPITDTAVWSLAAKDTLIRPRKSVPQISSSVSLFCASSLYNVVQMYFTPEIAVSICCLRNLFPILVWHLSNSIENTYISSEKCSWTSL